MHIPPPLIGFILIAIMFVLNWLAPSLKLEITGQKTFGTLLLVAGIGIAFMAGAGFARAKTTVLPNQIDKSSSLVTTGVYRFTRNPMYLGMALVVAGAGIGGGSILMPLAVVGFVMIINKVQIAPEEVGLSKIFGADYEAYCARVRRWI